jgi:hypothetical protein
MSVTFLPSGNTVIFAKASVMVCIGCLCVFEYQESNQERFQTETPNAGRDGCYCQDKYIT